MITRITKEDIQAFKKHLYINEKANTTITKYLYAVEKFAIFLNGRTVEKHLLLEYRDRLLTKCKAQTVNGRLSAINAFLSFHQMTECKVKLLKVQRQAFLDESKELSQKEYRQLLETARRKGNQRLYLLMVTLCATGIRIGELEFITVEAVQSGRVEIYFKGKNRTIILQKELKCKLQRYIKKQKLEKGAIFRTKNGRPLDRSNICHDMKKLCQQAGVERSKVFPHNLRHLFARTYYAIDKNLAHLSDLLGHSKVETTRIYVAVSASEHERILRKMKLIL